MNWKLSLPERPKLVYYFLKLIGLAPFAVNENRFYPPTPLNKLHSVSLASGYFLSATIAIFIDLSTLPSERTSLLTQIVVAIERLSSLPTTCLTVAMFLLMHEKILYIMNKLCIIGNELKSLGIEEDHGTFLKNAFITTVKANAVLIAICVTLYFLETNWSIYSSIKYIIDCVVYFNVILIFTHVLSVIRQRSKLMNEKLNDMFGPAGHRRSRNHLQIFVVCRNPRGTDQPGVEELTDLQRLRKIERLHLELCDLVDRTTHLFEVPIITRTVHSSTELMTYFFWMRYVIQSPGQLYDAGEIVSFVRTILCTLVKMIIVIVQLFVVAYATVETCEEGNATKVMLFRVWYKFKPRELVNEIFMFSLQLMHQPINVSAFGYFDLDYSYLYEIFCAVVAYVIILIQFDTSKSNTGT